MACLGSLLVLPNGARLGYRPTDLDVSPPTDRAKGFLPALGDRVSTLGEIRWGRPPGAALRSGLRFAAAHPCASTEQHGMPHSGGVARTALSDESVRTLDSGTVLGW